MQAESVQNELAESKQALEAARSEVECLREMVTSWEEAFGKAQLELDSLKVGLQLPLVFWCKILHGSDDACEEERDRLQFAYACIPAPVIRSMLCA